MWRLAGSLAVAFNAGVARDERRGQVIVSIDVRSSGRREAKQAVHDFRV
jgi:hypothetical protein